MEKKPSFYTDLLKKADLEHPDKYKLIYFLEKLCLLMPRTVVEYLVHFSFPLSCSYIGQLYIKGQLTRLYAFIFKLLLNKKFQQKQPLNWWRLMRLAIILTQQQQIQTGVKNIHLENKLIDLSLANKINRIGYDVAYVFLSYSLWAFEQGNLPEAILFIQESIASDNTWGYPEYL
ncbi:MAG: hypothetical protein JWM09_362, partial [Francisellaceae bacterium]|nr:hypothetical protein [Francisellaceae bacterium]